MHLVNFLKPSLIILDSAPETKIEAVKLLIEKLSHDMPQIDPVQTLNNILHRETLTSTTFKNGLSIPHARIEGFNDLVIGVLIPRIPLYDGENEIKIIFLILTEQSKSNLYLNIIASISKIFSDGHNVDFLAGAESPDDFINKLGSFDSMVRKTVYIRDLMSSPVKSLLPESTIKEALDFMSINHFGYIPVCDKNGMLVGEVYIHNILGIGVPEYARMLTSMKFISSLEPLEDLLKNEKSIKISSVMKKPTVLFSPDTPIMEAIFQFIKNQPRRYFPVVEGGVCIGVISYMDIINKFLRV